MSKPNGAPSVEGYKVDSGVPLPAGRRERKYPFDTMNVGDSFALASNDVQELERVRAAASYWGIRHTGQKFGVRMVDPITKNYRCWRIK